MGRFRSLLFALLFASAIVAAAPPADYFPLQVGTHWVYRQAGAIHGQPVVVEVLETERIAGKQYFLFSGLTPEAAWIRVSGDGVLSSLDRESGREALWSIQADGKKLSASLRIDNHVLKGEGEPDGTQFDVLLVHADGSGPGHTERLRRSGRLEADRIVGSFDNGIDQGRWTGRRVQ